MTIKDYWVGSLHFSEAFGDDLLNRLNDLPPITAVDGNQYKIRAQHLIIHEISLDFQSKYDLIIDRQGYLYPYVIGIFMGYAYRGVYLINNPFSFYYYLTNKDAGYIIASELGVSVPKTYILPPKEAPDLKPEDFKYHRWFDWQKIGDELGFPVIIKPAGGWEAIGVNIAHNLEELIYYYNQSGSKVMTVQEKVKTPYDWQIRCLCVGRKIIPIKYIFRKNDAGEYIFDSDFLSPELGKKVIDSCKIINRALGYEVNSIEFFIDEAGNPQAIDFNNPVPDGRRNTLGEVFYEDYQQAFITLISDIVREQRSLSYIPKRSNLFPEIARRQDLTSEEKFQQALVVANEYYEPEQN